MKKLILHLCADIGSDTKPYQQSQEYEVILVVSKIGIENYEPPLNVYGIVANPPCTHFSKAKMRTSKVQRDLKEGMRLVKECQRIIWTCLYNQHQEPSRTMPLKFWAIENPATGFLKWFLGKPTFEYCPSEFGAGHTKRTALWGCFTPPHKPFMEYMQKKTFSLVSSQKGAPRSMHARSMCYEPFARAFFEANR